MKRGERRTVAQKRKFRRVHGLLGGLNCFPGNTPSWLYISCKASWGKEKRKRVHNVCIKQPKINQLHDNIQDSICATNSSRVHSIQFHLLSLIWALLLTIQVTFKPFEGNFGTIKNGNLIVLCTTKYLHPACKLLKNLGQLQARDQFRHYQPSKLGAFPSCFYSQKGQHDSAKHSRKILYGKPGGEGKEWAESRDSTTPAPTQPCNSHCSPSWACRGAILEHTTQRNKVPTTFPQSVRLFFKVSKPLPRMAQVQVFLGFISFFF